MENTNTNTAEETATLNKIDLAPMHCMSKDKTRLALNSVYFENEKDEGRIVATDGRILSYIEKPEPFATDSVVVGKDEVKTLNRCKFFKMLGEIAHADTGTVSLNPMEFTFPQYRQVVESAMNNKSVCTMRLSLTVLESMVKTLKQAKADDVELSFSDEFKPVVGKSKTSNGDPLTIVAMPMHRG